MSRKQRFASIITSGAVIAGLAVFAVPGQPAAAAPSPVSQILPTMVSATQLPTVQIDGVAWSSEVVGNNVYAAGRFANARPAGAAAGTNLTPRNNLLSYNIQTGVLNTSFAPSLNNQAYVVRSSPDGSRIYVGGQFTTANGVTRNRVAAYDTATGQLVASFAPNVNSVVKSLAVTNNAVYIGGSFTTVNGVARTRLAAVHPTTGALLNWNPGADATVQALVVTASGSKVIAGGAFSMVGGVTRNGLAALDPVTGVPLPWAINDTIYNHGNNAAILSLDADGEAVYGTGYVFGSIADGNLEGSFSADAETGEINWIQNCHGDHYGVWSSGSAVYHVNHAHYCTPVGGFPQSDPWAINMRFATAFSVDATGTNGRDEFAGGTYFNFEGTPSPTMYNWFPELTVGTFTGQSQAGWSISGNGQYVVMGGEFPRVNNVAQQGLVRFKVPAPGELTNPPRVSGVSFVPTVIGTGVGKVRIAWQSNWDRDDTTLTYRLVRNNQTATPIHVTTATSTFWNRPTMGYVDSGLTPGATYTYRLYVVDASGNTIAGNNVSVVAPSVGSTSAYDELVIDDGAAPYWSLGESAGNVAIDSSGFDDGRVGTGVTRGAAGSTIGSPGTASTFDGTPNGLITSQTAEPGPDVFTLSTWIRTTTVAGGKIIGFGTADTGASGSYDRHVYMDNAGRIWFGVYPNGVATLNSTTSYNDGEWHQIVASLGADGMKLSIDGKPVAARSDVTFGQSYNGFWRVGGDNINGWPSQPTSQYFAGDIDNVAFFPTVLSRAAIRDQYVASGRTLGAPAPVDAYGAAVHADDPDLYWRLGDAPGSNLAADSGSYTTTGTVTSGVTFGQAGGVLGTTDTSAGFDGAGAIVVSQTAVNNPTVYTQEAWFKTATTTGGKILGFGTSNGTGLTPGDNLSGGYDRHVYMQDDGKLVFGTYTGQLNMATSPRSYNDDQWHHVAASQGPDGMKLYVDGTLVATNAQTQAQNYTGYWRIGGDNTWGSSSPWFNGLIDEAAVYSKVLTATQVAQRYTLGSGLVPNIAPDASFTSSVTGLAATFDGSGSTDPDGSVASYSWSFGDGATAGPSSSPTASHTYTAGGTFTVTLTVTDDGNVSTSTTRTVTTVDAYGAAVAADAPFLFWRLGEPSGNTALDASGNNRNGTYQNGVALGVPGPIAGSTSTAALFDGNDDVVVASAQVAGPSVFSTEVWFNTTSTAGGKILGFGNAPSGNSTNYDRHIYMDGAGVVRFGVWNGQADTVASPTALNDGQWHQVVATQGADGMKLYVDGVLVGTNPVTTQQPYNGYWRVGGDSTWAGNNYLSGALANASVYTGVLTPARVAAHYEAVTQVPIPNDAPTAGFTSSATDLSVAFTSTSVDTDGSIVAHAWNFGDGGTSTLESPVHAFTVGGTYTVTLTVTDDDGAQDAITADVTVVAPNQAPTASFTSAATDLTIDVTSTSTDADGTIAGVSWDFGDGSPGSTDPNSSHTYAAAGTYTVALTVTDDDGTTATATQTITVVAANVGPTAAFTSTPTDLTVAFDASASTDPDGTIAGYTWNFGDGTTGDGVTTTHLYTAGGTFTVTLTVTDDDGVTASTTRTVTVVEPPNQLPAAAIVVSSQTDLTVNLSAATSSDPDGTIVDRAWEFGDGTTGNGATVQHVYTTAGTYTLTLTVTDDDGATDTATQVVTVTDPPVNQSPVAAFTATPTNLQVAFDAATSTDPDGTITNYAWNFGDGSTGSGATASRTYAAAGTYTVTLTVTDDGGATDIETASVTVTAPVGPVLVATDTFGRTQATGLGSAELGGAWTQSGASTLFSVANGTGRIRMAAAGSGPSATLNAVSVRDVDATVDISLDKAATGGGLYVSLGARRVGTNDYRAKVRYLSTGAVQLYLSRTVNGAETTLRSVTVPGLTVVPGEVLRVRFQVSGTTTATLNAKVWRANQAEPAGWQNTTTDTTAALNTAGGLLLMSYLSGSSTNAPVVASFDNLAALRMN